VTSIKNVEHIGYLSASKTY